MPRRTSKIPKVSMLPFIDCLLLLLLLLVCLFWVANEPIRAIPVEIGNRDHKREFIPSSKSFVPLKNFVIVDIENPSPDSGDGTMHFIEVYKGIDPRFSPWIDIESWSKAEREKRRNARQKRQQQLHRRVEYEEIFSRLKLLPKARKKTMVIHSGREVLHEQIVRVLEIGEASGVERFEFERFEFE